MVSQISFPAMLLLLLLAGSLAHSLTRGHGNAEMLFSLVMWLEGMMSIGGFSLEARLTLVGVMQSTCIPLTIYSTTAPIALYVAH